MRKKATFLVVLAVLVLGISLGFSGRKNNDVPLNGSRSVNSETKSSNIVELRNPRTNNQTDFGGAPNVVSGLAYYTDNFNGANDTTALKSRGYIIFRNGTFTGTPGAQWFQGNPTVFTAFNGPTDGYVGSNYTSGGSTIGNIDNWLILPKKNVLATDSMFFYSRSPEASPYPDSIRVMYSAAGDSTPSAGSWVELGRFKVNVAGAWERKGFKAASAGANARYAIRYCVVNGGLSGTNSDYIGIDALTLETASIANDVSTQSIDSVYNYALPVNTIAPRATFKNDGTNNQTNVPVTYSVSGPVNYSNTKMIASLNAGEVKQVVFDSTFLPNLEGTYNITVYTSLATDGNRANDTLRTSFFVVEPNYGSGGTYFFANSTDGAAPAPSQPSYCWIDTAGSTSLVVNNVLSRPVTAGNIDDGHFGISLGGTKKIKFMGVEYDSAYIGTNGLIGFVNFIPGGGNWYPPANGLPGNGSGGTSRPAVYPLWNDLDWSDVSQPNNRLSYKIDLANNRLVVTYDRAPLYGAVDSTNYEIFQAVIELVNAGGSNSRIAFNYSNQTQYINLPLLSGLQDATGTNWLQYTFYNSAGDVFSAGPLFTAEPGSGVTVMFGPDASALSGFCAPAGQTLNLTVKMEGYTLMDTVTVELRNSTAPYALVESVKGMGGLATSQPISFTAASDGVPYAIVVKYRNGIATWSSGNVTFAGGVASYNFTTAISQAFGNNQKLVSGQASIYQGDVNQSGGVNLADITSIYNAATAFTSGYNVNNLINNATVNLSSITIAFNNASSFIVVKPRP